MALTVFDSAVIALGGIALLMVWKRRAQHAVPLPPGPKPLPLIGNALDMPMGKVWLKYTEWREQYGPVTYLTVAGQSILIVNSLRVILDLCEKRSSNYSSRILPTMLHLSDQTWQFSLIKYGTAWRLRRKMFHLGFHPTSTARYHPVQERSAYMLLKNILSKPEAFYDHLRDFAAGSILEIVYGYHIAEKNDRLVADASAALEMAEVITRPGVYLVDLFPFLRHIPEWVPGAKFQREARECKELFETFRNRPFNDLLKRMADGDAPACYTTDLLTNPDQSISGDKEAVKESAGIAYAAGADTTVSVLKYFMILMVNNPKEQALAQQELDDVIGDDRLPNADDRPSLPYVEALLKEVMRFAPSLPLSVPHASVEEDVYNGYTIPADTLIIPNTWGILHDPALYHEPFKFKPERFSGPKPEQDPKAAGAFGFGRRICAGRFMADTSVYLAIANVLAAFNITNEIDETGRPIEARIVEGEGLISHPLPFKCRITPRSEKYVALIQQA